MKENRKGKDRALIKTEKAEDHKTGWGGGRSSTPPPKNIQYRHMIKSSESSQDSPYYTRAKHLLFKSSKKVPLTASCGWQWPLSANTALVPPACLPLPCVSLTCPEKDRQSQAPSTHSKVPWEHTFPCCNQNTNSRNPLVLPSSVWDEVGEVSPPLFQGGKKDSSHKSETGDFVFHLPIHWS